MAGDGRELDKNTVALTSGGKTSRLLRSGEIIGDSYRLKGLIGRGGMGYVFLAEHIVMGEDYALKMLAPDQINAVTWNRFQSEGKAIARLDHPNIVKIYNMGVDKGDCPYYVMDLLDGVALSDCITDKRPFSLDQILNLFFQIASGLGYAHSRGIIHRDVKPSNVVLVDKPGQYPTAKIVDFGIAKLVDSQGLPNQNQTATGEIFGSPFYMSPEQCLGTEIDHRADIYSLGCTLFEVLSGQPPFVGESAVQTVMMHQNKPSPTLESVSAIFSSDEMEALVAKMLMKRPADRYQSMDQVLHDLDRIWQRKAVGKNVETGFKSSIDSQLADMGSKYQEEPQSRSRRNKILIIGGLVVLGCAAAASAFMLLNVVRPSAKTPQATPASTIVTDSEYSANASRVDRELAESAKKIAAVKSITSSVDETDGKRVFHCPDVHIGTFIWPLRKKDHVPLDLDGPNDDGVDVYGETRVPADRPIFLRIEEGRNRETWNLPVILQKFGPKEVTGLKLFSRFSMAQGGTDIEQRVELEQIAAMVKAISDWTNCRDFEFLNVPAPEQALIALDEHKELRQFTARGAYPNAKVLAQRQFMHRLSALSLTDMDDCDTVLCALKGSSSIEMISLSHSSMSASGLKALASCPNLIDLDLERCTLDTSALEAISRIKSLKKLRIDETKLFPGQIPVLAKLRYIKHVELYRQLWPREKIEELHKLLPNADFIVPDHD